MAEIVLYSRPDDEQLVRPAVEALHAQGLDFWWERGSPLAGDTRAQLADARCVVLFLSAAALRDDGFLTLLRSATIRGIAIGALLTRPAAAKGLGIQTLIDLSRYRGGKNDLFIQDLAAAAKAKAAGIDPPPPRGPISRFTKRVVIVSSAIFVVAAAALGVIASTTQLLSTKFFPMPREQAAWNSIAMGQPGACDALRRIHDGYYAERASGLLAAHRTVRMLDPQPSSTGNFPHTVMASQATAASTEAAARADFLARFQAEAADQCLDIAAADGSRSLGAVVDPATAQVECRQFTAGYRCAMTAKFVCRLQQSRDVEICG